MRRATVALGIAIGMLLPAGTAAGRVLRVGTYHGIRGQYRTVQGAVDHARPGDWILIAPGDYKTTSSRAPAGYSDFPAAVLITKHGLKLRGMNRNTVIIDGTKPGSPRCSSNQADQNFGPSSPKGPTGLNGIMVWKADNVTVENLTACNFLSGSADTGNEIWWNGGANSGTIGGWGFTGKYLNATSTFYGGDATAAQYGIFSSNWSGGKWVHTYTSNFSDSGYYIGACRQVCNQTIDDAWAEYSSLGYSGSNSGGRMLIEHSQFDNNKDGFDTNSQNGDNPPPQDGACPKGVKPPIKGAPSCWVFYRNYVHDNNNPNVPQVGASGSGPVGTGMSVSGGRNDTILNNRFERNNAWGVILVPYPDSGGPCTGGTMGELGPGSCVYDEWGDALLDNTFGANGGYRNPTNGDFAQLNFESGHPTDCYSGNTEEGGGSVTSSPSNLQQQHPSCDGSPAAANPNPLFLNEVACDSQALGTPCLPGDNYPRRAMVVMHPLPTGRLPTMPHPCRGVPANPWCPRGRGYKHRARG